MKTYIAVYLTISLLNCQSQEKQEEYLQKEDCRLMDESGKSMKGFLMVSPEGVDMDDDLDKWVERCLDFNPRAKSSKKKKA